MPDTLLSGSSIILTQCWLANALHELQVTHLFRDVLHGWGQILLSVNVSPCAKDYDETAHVLKVTLKYLPTHSLNPCMANERNSSMRSCCGHAYSCHTRTGDTADRSAHTCCTCCGMTHTLPRVVAMQSMRGVNRLVDSSVNAVNE